MIPRWRKKNKNKNKSQVKHEIISPPNIHMDDFNTWNKEKVIPKPGVSGQSIARRKTLPYVKILYS